MPPDEPSPDSEKKAAEKPAKVALPADASTNRTRSVVMMVLATLALTAVLTLIAESVFRGPKTVASANVANSSTAATTSSGDVPPLGSVTPRAPTGPQVPMIFVAVTFDHIEVDGIEVEKIGPLIQSKQTGNLGKLAAVMDLKRGGSSVGGPVGLAVEQGVPRNVIKSVFGTLALAGFRDVHLVGANPDGGIAGLPEGGVRIAD